MQIWWSELKSFEQLLIQIFRIGSLEPHTWFLITCKKKPHLEKKADTWNIPSSHISFLGGVWYHLHVGVRWVYGASMHPTKRGVTGLLMLYLKTNETNKIQQLQVEIILKQQTQTFMSTFHFHQQRFWQPRKNKVEYIPRCSPVFQGQQGFFRPNFISPRFVQVMPRERQQDMSLVSVFFQTVKATERHMRRSFFAVIPWCWFLVFFFRCPKIRDLVNVDYMPKKIENAGRKYSLKHIMYVFGICASYMYWEFAWLSVPWT